MGWAKHKLIELEQERREALDTLPRTLEEHVAAIEESSAVITALRAQVETLQAQLAARGSPKERLKDYVIGGIIGAVISLVLSAVL